MVRPSAVSDLYGLTVLSIPQTTSNMETTNRTHESDIAPLAIKCRAPPASLTSITTQSTLSFALPTSLAFFKRLTWELTPWKRLPISFATATLVSTYIPSIPPSALPFALCLGVSYLGYINSPKDKLPHLYVVFPHLRRDVSNDEKFLRVWHDEVVKPAFDEAWIRSGLVDVWEDPKDYKLVTGEIAPSADETFERFKRLKHPQYCLWPAWKDEWAHSHPPPGRLAHGEEGGFSDRRVDVFNEAWSAMRGILNGREEPGEMSDPVLLAVWMKEAHAGEGVGAENLMNFVGKEWDAYTDSRFVQNGMFVVHVKQEQGNKEHCEAEERVEKGIADPGREENGSWCCVS
ncbi:hypothetical protein N0V90_009506 [Kalmusia sp. IMI 367209]|nr:hypothetical protein N0V90_009506 [Kalmusia sp. IMI 367209]